MKAIELLLRVLRTDLDDERRVRVCIQEQAELERSRTTAVEDAVNVQARYFPDIRNTLNLLNRNIKTNKAQRIAAHEKLVASILANEQDGHAVLDAHTASLFRLEQSLDKLSQRLDQYPDPGAICLLVENRPDRHEADAKALVDAAESIVNPACTDYGRATDPIAS